MAQIQGIIGVFFILFLAFLLSNNKSNVNYISKSRSGYETNALSIIFAYTQMKRFRV